MGYPSEIPNRIPPRGEPPRRGVLARLLDRLLAPFRRRPRRKADAPEKYGQGVDPRLPPLTPRDRERIDFDELTRGRR